MSVVLQLENVAKVYRLGELNRGVFWRDWRRRLQGDLTEISEEDPNLFWALRDVSLEVRDGEVVGLLGRNGAGKSTLLKILAQITAPTHGCVRLRGRVASLLEVGTGFHPDMTGRDNVYLNGSILGMTRREVQQRFDQIVEFSGIEEFIDTPVKRYSMGMRVRLAFAVAAHLDPEILLVDEVLTVGDAGFQQKCLGKLGEVSRSGRTVLLVSHNAAAVESLCQRGILLERGRVVFDGTQTDALEAAVAGRAALIQDLQHRSDRGGSGEVRITSMEIRGRGSSGPARPRAGSPLEIALTFERHSSATFPRVAAQISVTDRLGAPIFTHANWLTGDLFPGLPARGTFVCELPRLPLIAGHYHVSFRIMAEMRPNGTILDEVESAAELHVESGDFFGSGQLPGPRMGSTLVEGTWRMDPTFA
jgi:lipopolysaccharide transport system ATP-binding protein